MAKSTIIKAYDIVKTYTGKNNQIHYYKKLYENNKLILDDFSTQYILKNHDYEPIIVNKVIKIASDLGKVLCDKFNLDNIPDKIFLCSIIGEMGGSYHCYIKSKIAGVTLMYIKKRSILDKLIDIDYQSLDIDFDVYDNMPTNQGRKLKEHQKLGAKFLIANKKAILADGMGLGKMQDVNTLTPTPNGMVKFGDLKVGDKIFGSDGKEHNILGIFPHKQKDLYEITFSDGTKTNSGLEHLWIVKEHMLDNDWRVMSLQSIINRGIIRKNYGIQSYRFQIPVCKPIEFKEKELKVSPYEYAVETHKNPHKIKDEYKYASIEQRKQLLYGFMDTNGNISREDYNITYSTKSKILSNDVAFIIRSLGGICKIVKENENYLLLINIPFNPFTDKEKSEIYNNNTTHEYYLTKFITSIKKLKTSDAMCIKVDSDDESYLTEDFIVTHNTTTSIIAALAGGYKNILIITTASLKTNWKKDLILYEDENNINIVNGSTWTPGKKFTVINYDIIDNFYEVPMEPVYEIQEITDSEGNVIETLKAPVMIKDKKTGKLVPKMQKSRKKQDIINSLNNSPLFLEDYDCVIIDEAQKLSNKGSIRYTAIADFLSKSSPKGVFLLTGTPLTNNPMNLYNILKLIDADVIHDYRYYVQRYCGGVEHTKRDGHKFWTYSGATHLDELREKIKDVYIRRLAYETGEMVDKSIVKKYYDLTPIQRFEYEKLWEEYQQAIENDEKREETEQYRQLIEGTLVRQYLAKEMTQQTIEMVDEYIEQGEKVVIITCFQDEMDILKNHFGKKCVTYNGTMSIKQKDKAQSEFMNNDKVMVFIGQIVACGVGLSLPVSKTLIFNSFSFSNADNKQAEDRVYRLTQTQDVEIIYQLFNNTFSQEMFDKVLYKEYISSSVFKSEKQKEEIKNNK